MIKAKKKTTPEKCACGCGEMTTRTVRLLREQDRGTAEALRWAETSIAPMRVPVYVVEGHEHPDGLDGFVVPPAVMLLVKGAWVATRCTNRDGSLEEEIHLS